MRPFTPAPVITAPSPPVRTLRHRNLLWAYRARFWLVHIGDPSSNQATTLESQMIHMIQELFGQTLRISDTEEAEMKASIALSALLITGFVAASTEKASAVVYCQYIEYP